jgi:hypothetical protein
VQAGEWAWYLSRLTTACTAGLLQGLYLLRSGRAAPTVRRRRRRRRRTRARAAAAPAAA